MFAPWAILEGAMAYLRTLPYLNGKVGLIGFCSGGRQTYLAACTLEGVIDAYLARPLGRRRDRTAAWC